MSDKPSNTLSTGKMVTIVIMLLFIIAGIVMIGIVAKKSNPKQKIIVNDMSNVEVDPHLNLEVHINDKDDECICSDFTKGDVHIKGYCSSNRDIIPTELIDGNYDKSTISIVGLYIAKKDNTYFAGYKIIDTYYYYVSDDATEEEFIDFLKSCLSE